jgi:hypothetical protein
MTRREITAVIRETQELNRPRDRGHPPAHPRGARGRPPDPSGDHGDPGPDRRAGPLILRLS